MRRCFSRCRIFLPLILALYFYGCALPLRPNASVTRDRAFISYWPVSGNSGKLRLAVKDLIDMKGEVTTAGSQYLAKNSPPARRDATLLQRARPVSYTHLRAHETPEHLVCRLLLEKK